MSAPIGDVDARRGAFRGARALVVGLGLTGEAAARTLAALGADVVAIDTRPDVAARAAASLTGVLVLEPEPTAGGPHGDPQDEAADRSRAASALVERALALDPRLAVVSPGIPPASPLIALPRAAGLDVMSEFDLAWLVRADDAPWLFVTGTNGKTTTAQMTSALLRAGGLHAPPLGNMGVAVSTVALEGIADDAGVVRPPEAWPIEIAALQLYDTHRAEPTASICLNVAEDHLDHFGSMAAYRAAKASVYSRVRLACVYPTWEDGARAMVEEAGVLEGARAVGLTLGVPGPSEIGVVEDLVVDRAFHPRRWTEALALFTPDDLAHLGGAAGVPPHVLTNAMAAAALARAGGTPAEAVAPGLRGFRLDAHRSAVVAEADEITWINDSKATNAHAAAAALRAIPAGTVVWLAGGDAKGADLEELIAQYAPAMRAVVLLGVDRSPWLGPLRRHAPHLPVFEVPDGDDGEVMRVAVRAARDHARPGDTVLLAPAGASWDQFRNYGHRGDAFAAAVRDLLGTA